MIIARQKRKENIAEYLLYMWQVEDLIRANKFDMDSINRTVIAHYDQPEEAQLIIRRFLISYSSGLNRVERICRS